MQKNSRARNSASAGDVAKLIRGELVKGLEQDKYMLIDVDAVCDHYTAFLCSVLRITPRPTAKLIEEAAQIAFKCPLPEAQAFGARMNQCVVYCRNKAKSMSSGSKLSSGVRAIVKQLQTGVRASESASPLRISQCLRKKARELVRATSTGSNDSCLPKPVSSSSSSFPGPSVQEVLASYGIGPPKFVGVVDIESSQEPVVQAALPSTSSKPWFCNQDLCMKMFSDTGHVVSAKMSPGPSGFALAQFESAEAMVTELPNLMLNVLKRPARQVRKRPAMKKPASKRPATNVDFKEDEDEDGDDAVDEDAGDEDGEPGGPPPPLGGAPPAGKPANFHFDAMVWGKCKAEFYTHKSYIRHYIDEKWVLVIQCEKDNHHAILTRLVEKVKTGMNKEELTAYRNTLQ